MKKLSVKQMYYILWVTIINQSQNALTEDERCDILSLQLYITN